MVMGWRELHCFDNSSRGVQEWGELGTRLDLLGCAVKFDNNEVPPSPAFYL